MDQIGVINAIDLRQDGHSAVGGLCDGPQSVPTLDRINPLGLTFRLRRRDNRGLIEGPGVYPPIIFGLREEGLGVTV